MQSMHVLEYSEQLLLWIGAVGGDMSQATNLKLATCTVKTIFSNGDTYAALCSNGKVVAWGDSDCALPFISHA